MVVGTDNPIHRGIRVACDYRNLFLQYASVTHCDNLNVLYAWHGGMKITGKASPIYNNLQHNKTDKDGRNLFL